MMWVVGLLVAVFVVVFGVALWGYRRRTVLAGRVAGRPTYMVDPPRRRVGKRRQERL